MTAQIVPIDQGKRRLSSWIGGFLQYSKGAQTNDPFRLWSAIAMISGALERKVWIKSQASSIYPNLYIFLVGPPGIGKTRPVNMACEIWGEMAGNLDTEKHHLARVSLTKAALMDQLAAAHRMMPETKEIFNALLIPSYELGALIPSYDPDFFNALTFLYDCIQYDEQRRGAKEALVIPRPVVTLIGCTTPGWLANTLPIGAWNEGFLARVLIIYSDHTETLKLRLNEENIEQDITLKSDLIHDIKEIGSMHGKMMFTREAGNAIEEWNEKERLKTAPDHPRLNYYNTRRPIQLLKLCMIAATDAGHLDIRHEDYITALSWLYGAEKAMSNVFVSMQSGGDVEVMKECWHWAVIQKVRVGGALSREMVHHYLSAKIPSSQIQRLVEEMVRCGMFDRDRTGDGFLPRAVLPKLF